MLSVIDQIRQKTSMPYRAVCKSLKLPYANFTRWRMREKQEAPLVCRPGPAKVETPDYGKLRHDIEQLSHGRHRTGGAGALYMRYATSASRRHMQELVAMARHDDNAADRQNLRRIQWNGTNVAWSMDPCEYAPSHINQMQDLASRYKFNPMTGEEEPCGEEIAGHLETTFRCFGPPLLLKRDNGGNLNHSAVDEVLEGHFVIPLNSPVHYPPYNGAIEEAQTELKSALRSKLLQKPCPGSHLEVYASSIEHDLNHKPRPCLNGKSSCQVYFSGRRSFSKWERRDAYAWITDLQSDIVSGKGVQPQAAWRIAAEVWLAKKGLITVTVNGKVLPSFFGFRTH